MMKPTTVLIALLATCFLVAIVSGGSYTVDYDPQTGEYTHFWFDISNPPKPLNIVYAGFLTIFNVIGPAMYFIMWGAFVVAAYLYTQDITMPLTVGILTGSLLSAAITQPEAQWLMMILTAIMLGGLLVKVILGR